MKITDGRIRLTASDLSNFLACRHLTVLDAAESRGGATSAAAFDLGFRDLIERGEAHEGRVLEEFRAQGATVVEIPTDAGQSDAERAAATVAALRSGADVVFQGVLLAEHVAPADEGGNGAVQLFGRPDFLVRATWLGSQPGPPGDSADDDRADRSPEGYAPDSYEVVDAKLARSAKARAVLQAVFYSQLVAEVTGRAPRRVHLALGNGEFSTHRVADFAAYERRIRDYLVDFVQRADGPRPPLYPEPVEHCAICRWRAECRATRRKDDDLSLVAGMPAGQRIVLKGVGVRTRTGFAALDEPPDLDGVSADSLQRAQLQARLQVESEQRGVVVHELLEPDRDHEGLLVANRGLLALPEPCEGDLFFDIEGARFYSEDGKEFGLQYLFGVVDTADRDQTGVPRYSQIWGFDRSGEKQAFEELVDFVTARRAVNPGLHVYHYNHYEPTSMEQLTALHETREEAVGRLMGRFATHEDEVDDLFRRGVFVDLYRVVRQSLRAGVESYSIKALEPMIGFERQVGLDEATEHLIAFESALDEGEGRDDRVSRGVVAGYNEDDCRATVALREWLEARRVDLAERLGASLPRPSAEEPEDTSADPDVVALKEALQAGVPDDAAARSPEQRARVVLADLLEWHRREAKPAWWRYFAVREMSAAELVDEPDAIGALSGGEKVGTVKRSVVRRFAFPPQEHGFVPGDKAHDSVTNKSWTVVEVDEEHGTIDLRIGKADLPAPTALVEGGPVEAKHLEARLRELAADVVGHGVSAAGAAGALLLRARPGPGDGDLREVGEQAGEAARRIIAGLGGSYLPVQGPPGAGKTFTAAGAIVNLIEQKRTVGVTAPSHAVICNLLDAVVAQAAARDVALRLGQKADTDGRFLHGEARSMDAAALATGLAGGELDVVAGTAWLWSRPELVRSVDTLFVDEAGQLSLANTLALAGAATNLVLLGDPQQLAQPSRAAHPPGSGVSALGHILGDYDTMPAAAGIFLDRTYRMHPELCRYTSEVFYDDRLGGVSGLERQRIDGGEGEWAPGLRFVEVDHSGSANASSEEAAEVVRVAGELLGASWTDRHGRAAPMTTGDILVVTPFNAQVREIDRALARAGITGLRVGTVDKFQGREAPAVIYSMAASSAGDAPRGLEFLFDLHRLNVATSRARALAVIIASPDLLRVFCRTPHQMVLANALCRAREAGDEPAT